MEELLKEIGVLVDCEARFQLPCLPVIAKLISHHLTMPKEVEQAPVTKHKKFVWPGNGIVDFRKYWQEVDKQQQTQ